MHNTKEGSLPDNILFFFKLKPSTNEITRQKGKFYVSLSDQNLNSNIFPYLV